MNFPFYIAKRYLFSKKSHNAINIISIVAVCGVAIATMATVCSMSVLNGFRGLVTDMFSSFDPELKITPVRGKVFNPDTVIFGEVYALPAIDLITESLEDNVMINYRGRQGLAILKGVGDNFVSQTNFASTLIDGDTILKNEVNNFALLGLGIANSIGVNTGFVFPLEIDAPKRNVKVNLSNPIASISREYAYIGGIFQVTQAVYDENYVIAPIRLARDLFDYEKEVSALEIKLKAGVSVKEAQAKIQKIIGCDFYVKDRYQQQEDTFKMINIEKWVTFFILIFILLIAAFNIIGSLSMLIIDKQADVITLRNLGSDNRQISRIFLFEGWLISASGAVAGIVLGVLLCLGQQHFGWLRLGNGNFSVNAYPVIISFSDLLFVLITVLVIGFFSVLYPVRYLVHSQLFSTFVQTKKQFL
ncbi:MAG: ABC transporter permease [Dysgonamonadaceae bacterium]|jgi:lipoprotein-releasing system permease protein/zinc transport system substrate-binding protein|nr:ABC transporter permease [Dysgonamonadaceae bacterium]